MRIASRSVSWVGCLCCVGLMAAALYFQYVQGLQPCPLCILQRVAVIGCAAVFLLTALINPGIGLGRVLGGLGVLISGMGVLVASRHLYLQHLPADQVPECGPDLYYMLEALPLTQTLSNVLTGSGSCAEQHWAWLGLSMPAWVLLWFVGFACVFALQLIHGHWPKRP